MQFERQQLGKVLRAIALLLPALVADFLLGWCLCRVATSFSSGEMPMVEWRTEHKTAFGVIWTLAVGGILGPIYLSIIFLSLSLFRLEWLEESKQGLQAWLVSMVLSLVVLLITFWVRVAVTAWFPTNMHPPFNAVRGGIPMGFAITLGSLACILAVWFVARRYFTGRRRTNQWD